MIPLGALVFAAALAASPAPSPAPAERTVLEHRVDAISDARLAGSDTLRLLSARRQKAGQRYQLERRVLLLCSILVPAYVLFRLWGSGLAARLRSSVQRAVSAQLVTFVFGLCVIGAGWLSALPFSFLDYRLSRLYGLTRIAPAAWFGSWLVQAIIASVLLALVASGILWLVDRTRVWYLYASAVVVLATVALAWINPVAIAPLVSVDKPLPRSALPLLTQRELAKSPVAAPLYVGEVPRTGLGAGTDGVDGTTRVVIGDYVIASASAREKAFVILRQFGHIATADPFRNALVFAAFGIVTLALAVALADRVPFRPDDDALSRIALVGASALLFSTVVWLPVASYLRGRDASADRYALRITGDRAAAVRSVIRTSDELLIPACPAADWSFPDIHQPPGRRIAAFLNQPDPCR